MRLTKHKNQILIFALTILILGTVYAQDDCQVKLEAISGSYEGGCKKGLAEGQGTAKGEDTYIGDFKKGLPHGSGTYTWSSGNIYVGEFKKGQKEGEGKLTVDLGGGQKKEQTGFWSKDRYIGQNKNPYEIINRTPDVLSVRVSETDNPANDGNALFIEIQHKAKVQSSPGFGITVNAGSMQNRFPVGNSTKVLIGQFPFVFSLNHMGESVELQFSQETTWKVVIDFNK